MRIIKIILITLLTITVTNCNTKTKELTKDEQVANYNANERKTALKMIQKGDLILRLGNDVVSQLLADLNPTDRSYSHCGIVTYINSVPHIYNINPKSSKTAQDDTIRLERVDSFISNQYNKAFAIYRFNITPQATDSILQAIQYYQSLKPHFDIRFNYADDSNMYCSELVAKAIRKANITTINIPNAYMEESKVIGVRRYFQLMNEQVDLRKYPIITLDNLYLHGNATKVYSAKYKKVTDF